MEPDVRGLLFELIGLEVGDSWLVAETIGLSREERFALGAPTIAPRPIHFSRRYQKEPNTVDTGSNRYSKLFNEVLKEQREERDRSLQADLLKQENQRKKLAEDLFEKYRLLDVDALRETLSLRQQELADQVEAGRLHNQPHCMLSDPEFWAKKTKLTAKEAAILSLGREPSVEIEGYLDGLTSEEMAKSPFLIRYADTLSLLENAFEAGALPDGPNTLEVLKWFERMELPFPDELSELIRKFWGKPSQAPQPKDDHLSSKERTSVLKLIAAMSAEQYKFNPAHTKSKAISSVLDDLDTVGLSLDRKTVSSWLNEAAKLIHEDYWEED